MDFNRMRGIADDLVKTPFQYGWMWAVEIEVPGIALPKGFQLYLKDISYGPVTIETKEVLAGSQKLSYPNGSAPVDITHTCRDHQDQRIYKWAKAQASKVLHSDGTYGIPAEFLVNWRRFTLFEDGSREETENIQVFIVGVGDITESREESNVMEFPLTYKQFRS